VGAVEKGRVIYNGIQLFVAFIMSVHIGEVIQIFFCVVWGCPIMRTPLQILFLILVTDLPPAIALGMEPGDPNIMKERPRPKTQPIILMWMWQSIIVNGLVLSAAIIITYLIALDYYLVYPEFGSTKISDEIVKEKDDYEDCRDGKGDYASKGKGSKEDCTDEDGWAYNLVRARTAAFIAVVCSENIRAYCSRSFTRFFMIQMFKNTNMQWAILIAQIAMWIVVAVLPVVGLIEIMWLSVWLLDANGFAIAAIGPFLTVVGCELYKLISKSQIQGFQNRVRKQLEEEEAARLEKFANFKSNYTDDGAPPQAK